MESARNIKKHEKAESAHIRKLTGGGWAHYNGEHPHKERHGWGNIVIPEDAPEWKKQWLEMQTPWCKKMYDNGGGVLKTKASIKEFVLFLIHKCDQQWGNTNQKHHWAIWHDRLSVLWDKSTQKWLCTLKCLIEGWPDCTFADRFVHIRGKHNDMATECCKDSMMGDSPE